MGIEDLQSIYIAGIDPPESAATINQLVLRFLVTSAPPESLTLPAERP